MKVTQLGGMVHVILTLNGKIKKYKVDDVNFFPFFVSGPVDRFGSVA